MSARVIDMTRVAIPQTAHSDSLDAFRPSFLSIPLSDDAWDWFDDHSGTWGDYDEEDTLYEAEESFRNYDPFEDERFPEMPATNRLPDGMKPGYRFSTLEQMREDFDPFSDLSLDAWKDTQPRLRQRSGKKMFWDWMKEFRGMPRQSFCKRMFNRFARRNGKEEIRLEMLTAVPCF